MELIIQAYADAVAAGAEPRTISAVREECEKRGIEFPKQILTLSSLRKAIWQFLFHKAESLTGADPNISSLSVFDRYRSLLYGWLELLSQHDEFLLNIYDHRSTPTLISDIGGARADFISWVTSVVEEGVRDGELSSRTCTGCGSAQFFWLQFLGCTLFWFRDGSPAREDSDAAVERSVEILEQTLGRGVVDAIVDFGRFLFAARKRCRR